MRQEIAPLRHALGSIRVAPRRRRARAALAAFAALFAVQSAPAAEPELAPDEVAARFVFQLLKYVTWPEASLSEKSFVVGVLGDDAFAGALRKVVGHEQAQGRPIEVRTVADPESPGLQLLYVHGSDRVDLREIARQHHGGSVLTVADRFEFAQLGGDVGLELVSGKVRFSINRRKAIRSDFVISSKLLRLASDVQ